MKTYYNILEIECSATIDDVRKAYRKMALKWHPGMLYTHAYNKNDKMLNS